MEHNEHNDDINQQPVVVPTEQTQQVPPSLLPTVLQRLGLTPEQVHSELPVEEVVAKLRSDDWEERAMAVRLLGKLGRIAPVELLESVLDDTDVSVRAAAIHAMGNVGKRAPLHRLVQALHDSDWHVRETAVFALGNQGSRVPPEVLKTALYDSDSTVREAARFALQGPATGSTTGPTTGPHAAVTYGQLSEKKMMQQNSDALDNEQAAGSTSYDTIPHEVWNGNYGYKGEHFQGVREQAQLYAPQESASYEHDSALPYGEKVTSYSQRRQSSKKWWFIIPAIALLFFILGIGVSQTANVSVLPHPVIGSASRVMKPAQKGTDPLYLLQSSQYGDVVRKQIAGGLHTTPDQITAQMKMGKSISDIAAAQGVSQDQLNKIELSAFSNALQQAVQAGDANQLEVDAWLVQFQNNPQQMEKITDTLFTSGPIVQPALPGN